jgi:hypothetical protein
MSLQDDYFDLKASLKGEKLKALERIWFGFCDLESLDMARHGTMTYADYWAWRAERIKELYGN